MDNPTSLSTNQIGLLLSMPAGRLESENIERDLESKGFIQIGTLLPVIEGEHHHTSHGEYQKLQNI